MTDWTNDLSVTCVPLALHIWDACQYVSNFETLNTASNDNNKSVQNIRLAGQRVIPHSCCATRLEHQIPWWPTDVELVRGQWLGVVDSLASGHVAGQRCRHSATWERQNDPTGSYDRWPPCCWTSRRMEDNHIAMHRAALPCSTHQPVQTCGAI